MSATDQPSAGIPLVKESGRNELHDERLDSERSASGERQHSLPLRPLQRPSIPLDDPNEGATDAIASARKTHDTAGGGLSESPSLTDADLEHQGHAAPELAGPIFTTSRDVAQPAMTSANDSLSHAPREDEYMDPTSQKPCLSKSPTRFPTDETSYFHSSPAARQLSDSGSDGGAACGNEGNKSLEKSKEKSDDYVPGDEDDGSRSEIQSIMDQFESNEDIPNEEEVMSPRLQIANPQLQAPICYPPRNSSLDPIKTPHVTVLPSSESAISTNFPTADAPLKQRSNTGMQDVPPVPSKEPSQPTNPPSKDSKSQLSSPSSVSLQKAAPPEPDPEPVLPFDFHRFLEQLRHRTADPVAKFLRSFLVEFGKKQWMVHEQVKIISDFLAFITNKMAQCEVWRGISDAEFDNAKEGMEKLVMNRLYTQTFSPAIPPTPAAQDIKGKRKNLEKLLGPARKGQHQEDIERDEILAQKVRIYGWVEEVHLDIPPIAESGRRFLSLAEQELLKIRTYRAPRDKVICVLNCCKVIFGLLRNTKSSDTSADSFVPLLIYVVLHANPDHLVSNVQYILRFRNQDKLSGEAGYYLSSLMGAVQFIEHLDRTSLTISDEDFEKRVEAAVSIIAEKHRGPPRPPQISEKSTLSEPAIAPRNSSGVEYSHSGRPSSLLQSKEQPGTSSLSDESNAVTGLLRTIQRPLSSLGRMFSEDTPNSQRLGDRGRQGSAMLHAEPPRRLSPAVFQPPRRSMDSSRSEDGLPGDNVIDKGPTGRLGIEDAAARQASAEAAEAQRIQLSEHSDVVETLAGMFPDLDRDVIDDVVRVKQGR